MILLDTHIWYWWIENNSKLTGFQRAQILKHHGDGLAVSIISVWEIAKLHSAGKIKMKLAIADWIEAALGFLNPKNS